MEYREQHQLKISEDDDMPSSQKSVRFNNVPKYRYIPATPPPTPQSSLSPRVDAKLAEYDRLVALIEKLLEQGAPVPQRLYEKTQAMRNMFRSEGIVI